MSLIKSLHTTYSVGSVLNLEMEQNEIITTIEIEYAFNLKNFQIIAKKGKKV